MVRRRRDAVTYSYGGLCASTPASIFATVNGTLVRADEELATAAQAAERTARPEGETTSSPARVQARRRRWGIGGALATIVLATLAPFVALEIYQAVQDVQIQGAALTDRVRAEASEGGETVDTGLAYAENLLATLAETPALQADGDAELLPALAVAQQQNPDFDGFAIVRGGSAAIGVGVFAGDALTMIQPSLASAQKGTSAGKLLIGAASASAGSSLRLLLAYPIPAATPAAPALLIASLNLQQLGRTIGYAGSPLASTVLLAEDSGTVIAASPGHGEWLGRTLTGLRQWGRIRTEQVGTIREALFGQPQIIGYQAASRAPWRVLATAPQSVADRDTRRLVLRIAEEASLAAVATAFIALIVLRRIVSPIRLLAQSAGAFAAGQLDRRIPLRRNDELGDLADSLEHMAASLGGRLEQEAAAARALRELNRLKDEFVATASHELRTPITALRTYLEALQRPEILDDETRQACLDGIDRSSLRLTRLAHALLDVSRIDGGRMTVRPTAVEPAVVARAAIARVAPHDDRIWLQAAAELPHAWADPDRLEDTLANLIDNARKFSPATAPIVLEVTAQGAEIVFTVRDCGIGIPGTEIPRIFERFYQVEAGASRNADGSGLGLYIAQGYVTAMGGRIIVKSVPGLGSAFSVIVPAAVTLLHDREDEEAHAISGDRVAGG